MAVPNTTTFTLQDVIDEVYATPPTSPNLEDAFNDANADYFNPTYYGTGNDLLEFRDYGSHNVVTYDVTARVTQLTDLSNVSGNIVLKTSTGVVYDTAGESISSSSLPYDVTFLDVPDTANYKIDVSDITGYNLTGDESTVVAYYSTNNVDWTQSTVTDTFVLTGDILRYFKFEFGSVIGGGGGGGGETTTMPPEEQ